MASTFAPVAYFAGSEIMRIMSSFFDGKVSVLSLSASVREPTPGSFRSTRGALFSPTPTVPAISYTLIMLVIFSIY